MKRILGFVMFYLFSIGSFLGIVLYSYQNKIDNHNSQIQIEYPGIWKLSDEYDDGKSNYMKFLRQKNSLDILKKVYKKLEKNRLYREYSRQILSYHDFFQGSKKNASGSYNEKTKKGYLTNLTVLQMPEKMIHEKKIKQKIDEGRCFVSQEYQKPLDREIPLIAGYDYQHVFSINQKIHAGYLGSGNYTFKIIGFLTKDNAISEEQNNNNVLIIPTVNKAESMSREDEEILMSVKCSGYLYYKNEKEYHQIVKLIKKIRRETGYRYVIPKIKWKSNNLLPVTREMALMIMIFCICIQCIIVYKLLRKGKNKTNIHIYKAVYLCVSGIIIGDVMLHLLFPEKARMIQVYFPEYTFCMGTEVLICMIIIRIKSKGHVFE